MALYSTLYSVALIPVAVSAIFALLQRRTGFGSLKLSTQQIIIGIVFGIVAITGTEFGIDAGGVKVNVRDAAPLCAGILFGGPAGIIAGCIGGVERWLAVYWGVGSFTRIACSVSTIIAGLFAAFLNKKLFENKDPDFVMAAAATVVMEVFHMIMVFMTNPGQAEVAYNVINICTIPMVTANAFAVFLATVVVLIIRRERLIDNDGMYSIMQKIERSLMVTFIIAFAATTIFTYVLQTNIYDNQVEHMLTTTLDDMQQGVTDASDTEILEKTKAIMPNLYMSQTDAVLNQMKKFYEVSEINIVDGDGIVTHSTNKNNIGFDIKSGEQSAEFMCIIEGEVDEYVQQFTRTSQNSAVRFKYAAVKFKDGFVQAGYDEAKFRNSLANQLNGMTENRHVGYSGYASIIDSNGLIVSSLFTEYEGKKLQELWTITIEEFTRDHSPYKKYIISDGDEDCYSMYATREGYYIFAMIPEKDFNMSRNLATYLIMFTEVLIFALLYGIINMLMRRQVVDNIVKVNKSLFEITNGNLEEKVDVRNSDEFNSLTEGINEMVDSLKELIAAAAAKNAADLELARNIQASSLPNVFPAFPSRNEIDLYALMDPAKEVGGDFYDFYWLDEKRIVLTVADVSGKGIPGAMFMMRAKTILKNYMMTGHSVEEAMTKANEGLCEGNDAEMFVTAWVGVVDVSTGHVEYANAGHNPPLIKTGDGEFEYLKSRAGFVLAGMDGIKYKKQEFDIVPGSVIYLYTDGMPEATNLEKELYGEERLLASANANKDADMETLCKNTKADADDFYDGAEQFDDMTIVAFRLIKNA